MLLDHVPPPADDNAVDEPTHTLLAPVINGEAFTVTTALALHPEPSV